MPNRPIALQLYTVRDHAEKDPAGTLDKVKSMGYENVEVASLYNLSAKDYKALLDEKKLTPVSIHAPFEAITGNTDAAIADAKALGIKFVVVPWVGGKAYKDTAAVQETARAMDTAGAKLRAEGLQLCYHNHAHEFEKHDGKTVFDIIFETASPENLASELDVAWVAIAGEDPAALTRRLGKRVPILHIKDYAEARPPKFAEVGTGKMAWDPLMAAARETGVQWYIVEQDGNFAVDSLVSALKGFEFLRSRL